MNRFLPDNFKEPFMRIFALLTCSLCWLAVQTGAAADDASSAAKTTAQESSEEKSGGQAQKAAQPQRSAVAWLAGQDCSQCHSTNQLVFDGHPGHGLIALRSTFHGHGTGKTQRVTYLGVSTSPVPDVLRKHLRLPPRAGLLVEGIESGSPAEAAGIEQYDVLEKLDQQLLINTEQLSALVRSLPAGKEVAVTLIHKNRPKTVTATMAEHEVTVEAPTGQVGVLRTPRYDLDGHHLYQAYVGLMDIAAATGGDAGPAYLGVSTSPPPPALVQQLGLAGGLGLLVDAVLPDSPAAAAGLKEHDLLEKLDDQVLVNPDQFSALVGMRRPGDEIELTAIRGGQSTSLRAVLAARPAEKTSEQPTEQPAHQPGEAPAEQPGDGPAEQPRAEPSQEADQPAAGQSSNTSYIAIDHLSGSGLRLDVPLAVDFAYQARGGLRDVVDLRRQESVTDEVFLRRAYLDTLGILPEPDEVKQFVESDSPDKRTQLLDSLMSRPDFITRFNGAASLRWSDDKHALTLTRLPDGQNRLLAKDAQGKLLFDGVVGQGDASPASLPADLAAKLSTMLEGIGGPDARPRSAEEALQTVLPRIEFADVPLKQAIEKLRRDTRANIVLNVKALQRAGVRIDEPVSLKLENVRLSTVLKTLLSLLTGETGAAAYTIEGEVIMVGKG
ncbi:MAG: PDZ domain-containing protein [Pirellulales bacterium]